MFSYELQLKSVELKILNSRIVLFDLGLRYGGAQNTSISETMRVDQARGQLLQRGQHGGDVGQLAVEPATSEPKPSVLANPTQLLWQRGEQQDGAIDQHHVPKQRELELERLEHQI